MTVAVRDGEVLLGYLLLILFLASEQVAEAMGNVTKDLDIQREAISLQSRSLFDVRGEESLGACKIFDRYLEIFGFFKVFNGGWEER